MKIAFNPSTVAALITPPNNKDITFDLRGQNIFARGVKFYGTDTNTWRDIKVNNVSIGSHTLDLRNGSNTTLTNTNGVVTINSTWRPVVDSLTSDSTTSSLSAKQGKVLKALIDGKSNLGHTHDDRYLKLTGGTMTGIIRATNRGGTWISGRDHCLIRSDDKTSSSYWSAILAIATVNGYWTLGHLGNGGERIGFNYDTDADYNAGRNNNHVIWLPTGGAEGTLALTSDIPSSLKNPYALTISLNGTSQGPYDGSAAKNINITPSSIDAATSSHTHDNRYLKLTGGTMQLGEGLKFHADDNYFGTNADARIISLLDGNDKVCDGGLIIDERATLNGTEYATELLRIRDSEFKWKGLNILHSGNYNSYSPTLTGIGASGTWGINITGTAAIANKTSKTLTFTGGSTATFNGSIDISVAIPTKSSWNYDDRYFFSNVVYYNTNSGGFEKNTPFWFKFCTLPGRGNGGEFYTIIIEATNGADAPQVTVVDLVRTYNNDSIRGWNLVLKTSHCYHNNLGNVALITIDESNNIWFYYDSTWNLNLRLKVSIQSTVSNITILTLNLAKATITTTTPTAAYGGNISIKRVPTAIYSTRGIIDVPTIYENGISLSSKYLGISANAVSATNADMVDGYHENSFLRYRGFTRTDLETTLWNLIGIKEYYGALPDGLTDIYNWGGVISLPGTYSRFEIYAAHNASSGTGLYYRSGWGSDKKTWLKFIDSSNIGSLSVNYANSAGNSDKVDGYHANGLLTSVTNTNNGISVTVGGTTKNISNISVNYANSAGNADTLDGLNSTKFLRQVVVPNNTENDFNTFSNMTLTGRVDPTTGASLKNAPWSGSGPGGGYGVLTYLFNGWDYGTQMAWEYGSNRIYIRNKHWGGSGVGAIWRTSWDTLALTSDIPSSLKNPNSLILKANGTTLAIYDGSSAKEANFTYANIGAASASHTHSNYVTDLDTNGNYLTWTKNGNTSNITVPYAGKTDWLIPQGFFSTLEQVDAFFDTVNHSLKVAYIGNKAFPEFSDGLVLAASVPSKYCHQIHMDDNQPVIHHRSRSGNGDSWSKWSKLLDSSNYSSYAIPVSASCNKNWSYSGQSGQPSWLWGSNDGTNCYVWNPSNFRVAYAASAGNADTLDGKHASDFATAEHNHNDLYVSSLTTNGNYLRWVKNGNNNDITIPYATGSSKLMYHGLIGYRTDFDSFTGENVIKVALFQNKGTDDEKLVPPFYDGSLISFPWRNDNNYGAQLAVEDSGQTNHLAIRNKINSNTWGAWAMILTSANYNLYSPKLDGTGASGTWDINITGNADTVDGYHATSGNDKPWGTIPAITTSGWMDIGKHLEFHFDNTTGSDYSTILRCTGNYSNVVNLPSATGTLALTSDIPTSLPANGGNADTTDGVHITWAGELTSTNHLVAWEANGSALRDINPANVTVGNSDKLDGIHASGLLTELSNSDNGISITIGGTTKSVSNISVNYASNAGNADTVDGAHLIRYGNETGIKQVYYFHRQGNNTSYIKLGTLNTVAVTGAGSSKVMFTVKGGINFGGTNESVYEVAASTRGSIQVTSTLVRGNRELKFGYVSTSSNVEIWMAYDGTYRGVTEVEVSSSVNFTLAMTEITTKPSGFVEGSYRILASTTDNVASATRLQTPRTIWGQSFDGTADISGTLSGVANILFSANNAYDIGSNSVASRYIYTHWLGAGTGLKLELGANDSGYGKGLCLDTNLNVGIGTNSPAYKLHVAGDIYSSATIRTAAQNQAIVLSNNSSPAWISALNGQVIFNTGNAIRFGETAWDANQWAGLKYTHSNKTIYLGIADNSVFDANSTLSGGTLNLRAGISSIDLNSGTSIRGLPTDGSPYSSSITLRNTSIHLSSYGDISMSTGYGVIKLSSGYGGIKLSCLGNNASIDSKGFKVEASQGVYLNSGNSGNVSLCQGGGNVGIGTMSPSYKLDVNGLMRASGFIHSDHSINDAVLLAGGGYGRIFMMGTTRYYNNTSYELSFHKLSNLCNNLVWVDGCIWNSTSTSFYVSSDFYPYLYANSPSMRTIYRMDGNNMITVDGNGMVVISCSSYPRRIGFFYTGRA